MGKKTDQERPFLFSDILGDQEDYDTSQHPDLIQKLYEQYRKDIFDEFLPFMKEHIIDWEYGGFLCNTDRDGTHVNTNKRTWYEGRGIWVYSFLYNYIDPNPEYLKIAQMSADFILPTMPEGKKLWTPWFTRDGKPLGGEDTELYSDLHVAEGLAEFAKATGDEKYWDLSKKILMKCMDIYDNQPGYGIDAHFYQFQVNEKKRWEGVDQPRIIGHWMDLTFLTTELLKVKDDPEVKKISDRCLDAVLNKHYNPRYDLINEYLNHDFSRIDSPQGEEVTGHVPETLWMIMYEAIRRDDQETFDRAAKMLKRHIEVLWDDVYGGAFQGLMDVDANEFDLTKALWVQDEILVGLMAVIERSDKAWAKEWFRKVYDWIQGKCSLRQYGYSLWMLYGDRKMTFTEHSDRIGNYHHPRQMLLNYLALERMIKAGRGF